MIPRWSKLLLLALALAGVLLLLAGFTLRRRMTS